MQRQLKRLAFYVLSFALPSALWALTITSPAPNSTLNGPVTFTADTGGDASIIAVEYLLQGQYFSGRLATPFVFNWNTANAWNTQASITAVGYDASGNTVATSPAVNYYVINTTTPYQNGDTPGILVLTSPDVSQPLSGIVDFQVTSTFLPGVAGITCYLDGVQQSSVKNVDTTQMSNGSHMLYCSATTWVDFGKTYIFLAMQYWPFTVNNPITGPGAPQGTPNSQIRMNYREVFLVPGETATLTAYATTNTGQAISAGPLVFQETPLPEWVVPQNPPTFVNYWFPFQHPVSITNNTSDHVDFIAVSTGMTQISVYSSVFQSTATARIFVNQAHALPHFSRSGAFLNSYQSGQSIFMRAIFAMGINDQIGPPATAADINTAEQGIYGNPADGGGSQNEPFSQWVVGAGASYANTLSEAQKYGMSLHFTGDDFVRTSNEFYDSVYDDTSTAKIQYALTWARDNGRTIGIDMMDEVDGGWGEDPTPAFTSFAGNLPPEPGVWSTYHNPPIGDDAFFILMEKFNAVTPTNSSIQHPVPLTWPTLGYDLDAYHLPQPANWMADPRFADYATLYNTPLGQLTYPMDGGTDSMIRVSDGPSVDWGQDTLRRDRPMLAETGFNGPTYYKQGTGYQYTPGQDKLVGPGTTPTQVAAALTFHAIRGMAGTRSYIFDGSLAPQNSSNSPAPVGATGPDGQLQTGTNPWWDGLDRWRAYASASNFLGMLEPYFLNPQKNSPDLGPEIATTVRESITPASRIFMILNYSDGPRTFAVDISTYLYSTSTYFKRYHQRVNEDWQEAVKYSDLGNGATDYLTVQGGETVAWVFLPNEGAPNLVAPAVPTDLTAQTSTYMNINLAWQEIPNADPAPIKDYLVFRNGVQVVVSTSTTLMDAGLSGSTTYFYQLKARDTDGNVSALSQPPVYATTFETPDLLEPWIKNVQASSITATTAFITWTTDKLSDSQVGYSSNTLADISNNYFTWTPISSTMTLTHSVQLTGLASGTVYYFMVRSRAQSNGLLADSLHYTFVTLFDGSIVGAIRIAGGNSTGFVDFSSHTWLSDRYFDMGGGGGALAAGTTIYNTTDDEVYLHNHIGTQFNYDIPLANGYYTLKLKFVETYCTTVHCRAADVTMNGQPILPGLDIFKVAPGTFTAYDWSYPGVFQVTTKNIQFGFTEDPSDGVSGTGRAGAIVSGIEIVLNCSDSTTMPTPDLSGVPPVLTIGGQMKAKYDPTCNIDHFNWTMTPQADASPPVIVNGIASAPSQAPTLAFPTQSALANLASQPPLPPGYFRVGVRAVSEAGAISNEGVTIVQLIGDELGNARVYPNPWRVDRDAATTKGVTFDLLTLTARVRIFDIAGRHVRSLTPTAGSVTWDLKNEKGQDVASGIYLYLLTDDNGQKATGKLVVIR